MFSEYVGRQTQGIDRDNEVRVTTFGLEFSSFFSQLCSKFDSIQEAALH